MEDFVFFPNLGSSAWDLGVRPGDFAVEATPSMIRPEIVVRFKELAHDAIALLKMNLAPGRVTGGAFSLLQPEYHCGGTFWGQGLKI